MSTEEAPIIPTVSRTRSKKYDTGDLTPGSLIQVNLIKGDRWPVVTVELDLSEKYKVNILGTFSKGDTVRFRSRKYFDVTVSGQNTANTIQHHLPTMEEVEYDVKIKNLMSDLQKEEARAQELKRDIQQRQELHRQRMVEKNEQLLDLRKEEPVDLRRVLEEGPWRLNPEHTDAEQAETILKYIDKIKTVFKCPVCLQIMNVSVLKCGHLLCSFCFHEINNMCPMGRCEIDHKIIEPRMWKRLVRQLEEYAPPQQVVESRRPAVGGYPTLLSRVLSPSP